MLPRLMIAGSTLLTVSWVGLSARGSDLSKFLHAAFDQQYSRPPTGTETNYYANVWRSAGPLEASIRMVSSEDYFAGQCRRDPQLYVTRLYQVFLQRDPRGDELRYWVGQFLYTDGTDRVTFVRQFCQANNVLQLPAAAVSYPGVVQLPGTASSSAATLVAKVDLLRSLVQREMGGTRFGRAVLDTVTNLLSAAMQYRDTAQTPQSTSQQVQIAADNVARALDGVERQFRAVPAASAQVQNLLWEIRQLVPAAGYPPAAGALPAAPVGWESSADRLALLVRQCAARLATFQQLDAFYAALYRDVSGLSVQAESLRELARTAPQRRDLQRVVNSMLSQATLITRQMGQADASLQQIWWNVRHELDRVAEATGCGGELYAAPDHPVVINPPAWGGFPAQLSPALGPSVVNRQVIDLADQLLMTIDTYVDSLRPLAARDRDVARMIDETLNLRHDVAVVRQSAAAGQFATQLSRASGAATRQYREAASQAFLQMVGQNATLNSPAWVRIGELTYEIDKVVAG
ncbi:MAG: DUF4214 domain-containing protein [Pirellulaceae bacterium]|nr:DUF4214 domain-containing protein [Pirellulaceae bacterium]